MTTPNRPLSAREFLSLPTSGVPFIPELHADDCDDVTCVRCVKPPTSTSRMDVPAAQVAAEFAALKAKRTTDGLLAEQRHQYLDLDADSVCRPVGFNCPACLPKPEAVS